jgi:hypothetical protein
VYHDDSRGARAWRQHQKNGRLRPPPLKEEDGEDSFLKIRFHSRDMCSIGGVGLLGWLASLDAHCSCAAWAVNESGEVGQSGRKGRGGPGQAGQLG